jgi:hypothetical protein
MLNLNLDEEAEHYLIDIVAAEQTTSSELIKQLLRTRWLALQTPRSFLERRGESPRHLLDGAADLSDRDVRKQKIADYLQQRHTAQQQP